MRNSGRCRDPLRYELRKNELIYNRGRNGQLMEETLSPVGGVAYFGGGGGEEGTIDCVSGWKQ